MMDQAQPSPIHQQDADAQAPVTEQPVSLRRALQPFSFSFFFFDLLLDAVDMAARKPTG